MKKIILLTTILALCVNLQVYAAKPTIHYIFDNIGVDDGVVIDQSGNDNNGKTDSIVEDGDTFKGTVTIPIEPFVNCETFTWSGIFYSGGGIPKIFNAESNNGYFSINGAGGFGMLRIFQYRLEDVVNDVYKNVMYYDYDISLDGQQHEYTLVQNEGYMSFYLDGQKFEPTSYSDDETTNVTLKYILSGENPQMQLHCNEINMIEFKMFDTALTEEEIQEIIKPKFPIVTSGYLIDGGIRVNMTIDTEINECDDAVLYIAEYNKDEILTHLESVDKAEFELNDYGVYNVNYTMKNPDSIVKCFVWDKNMKPYARPYKAISKK